MKRLVLLSSFCLVTLFMLAACGPMTTVYVTKLDPETNIDIAAINQKVYFEIGEDVKDTLWIYQNKLKDTQVTNWHASLRNGFNNAFNNFNIVKEKKEADLIFKIIKAKPDLTLVSVEEDDVELEYFSDIDSETVIFSGKITYNVRLLDSSSNKVLKRLAQTAESNEKGIKKWETRKVFNSAISVMYRTVSEKFFQDSSL